VPPVADHVAQADRNPRADPWRTATTFPPREAGRVALDLGTTRPTDETPLANSVVPTSGRGPTGSVLGAPGFDAAGATVNFDFRATGDVEVVGRPRLRLPVRPVGRPVHLFATLKHVAGGRARVINEQVTAVRVGAERTIDLECIGVQRHLAPGDGLRLTVSTTDNGYFSSRSVAGAVVGHAGDASPSVPVISDSGRSLIPAGPPG